MRSPHRLRSAGGEVRELGGDPAPGDGALSPFVAGGRPNGIYEVPLSRKRRDRRGPGARPQQGVWLKGLQTRGKRSSYPKLRQAQVEVQVNSRFSACRGLDGRRFLCSIAAHAGRLTAAR